jgi:hypothetical protein
MDAPAAIVESSLPESAESPEELKGPTPREIPEAIKQGRLYLRNRNAVWTLAAFGLGCVLLDELPFVQTLALYFLPLGYLLWIGIGLCAIAGYLYLAPGELKKAKRYIEEGEVGFGRVASLVKGPTVIHNGQPTSFAIVARVQIQNPQTGAIGTKELKSRNFSNKANEARFRVGDVVPVVWLPGQFESAAQIYDFLEVMPGHDLVARTESTAAQNAIKLSIILIVLGGLLWSAYAMVRYSPIDFEFRQGVLPVSIGAGVGLAVAMAGALVSAHKRRQLLEKNLAAKASGGTIEVEANQGNKIVNRVLITLGAMMFGAMASVGACWSANALFDKSAAKSTPIVVTNMVQVTHNFIFREYKMEYHFANEQAKQTLNTTPQHLSQFKIPFGIAQIRAGWLGWRWVETIEPINAAQPGAANGAPGQ